MIDIPKGFEYLEINDQIKETLERVYEKKENVFIIGKGGSGKSQTLKLIRAIDSEKKILSIFLAPTGIASVNIEGATIHSTFKFGIHPKKPTKHSLHPKTKDIINLCDRIVVDEVSMVNANLYDSMDYLCRKATGKDEFFGGKQILLCGDLFQLTPILGKSKEEVLFYTEDYGDNPYFFASKSYRENQNKIKPIIYNKIYRQENGDFIDILNRVREGKQTDEDLEVINSNMKAYIRYKSRIPESIYLAQYNKTVDDINATELKSIDEEEIILNGWVRGYINPKNYLVPVDIKLKKGCKVMMLTNHPNGLYQNGTLGYFDRLENGRVVVRIKGQEIYVDRYTFKEYTYEKIGEDLVKVEKGQFSQFPITLGYAFTIHKSQSSSFDSGYVDFGSSVFGQHMVYVALSRFRNVEGIGLKRKINHDDIKINYYAREFVNNLSVGGS